MKGDRFNQMFDLDGSLFRVRMESIEIAQSIFLVLLGSRPLTNT